MLDAKAEKLNDDRTATIQMSQTSMTVKMRRSGQDVNEPGKLDEVIARGTQSFYVVTVIAKYVYTNVEDFRELNRIIVACIPNGLLQKNTIHHQKTQFGSQVEMHPHEAKISEYG